MSGPTAVAFLGLIVGIGVGVVAIMLFQEARSRVQVEAPTYVISDAVAFASENVDPEVYGRLKKAGVQRVIEWSVHYLQGLAEKGTRRNAVTVVAGGEGNAIHYIAAQLAKRGHEYSEGDIAAVLATEGAYLESIGALGTIADESELA